MCSLWTDFTSPGEKITEMPNLGSNSRPQLAKTGHEVFISGRSAVGLTHVEKIFWPDEQLTKGDMLRYYEAIVPFILPYLRDRPLSLKRSPNGITGKSFYHKDAGEHVPQYVATYKVLSKSSSKVIDYIVCNNPATLLYVANLGCIEMNPWNSTTRKPDHPTYMVLDLDPSPMNDFNQVTDVALAVGEVLRRAGASSYCKTSGASGLHIYIPLNNRYNYISVKEFAHIIASEVHELLPELTTMERLISNRGNRVYIDYLQNSKGQTLVSAYSLRPVPGARVSAPLEWKEVKKGLDPTQFTIKSMMSRIAKKGDLFRDVLGTGIDIPKCLKNLSK